MNFSSALDYCESLGAKLYVPTSAEEEAYIWNLYPNKHYTNDENDGWLWINAVALDSSNLHNLTQFDGEELEYTNWNPGQPNTPPSEAGNWAFIRSIGSSDSPAWIDTPSGAHNLDFVCKVRGWYGE